MNIITKELIERFDREKDGIIESETFKEFLEHFTRTEHSLNNKALVYMQNKGATETQGFNTRIKMGRVVKRGEKALYIFAMNTTEKTDEKTGEKEMKKYFWVKAVYDISQTELLSDKK